ncbi:SCO1431 family membrane protein [Streptomyces sp. NBC_01381]|uniref:SCO1431 family membrane protein n=1 Tax=unclassified Streptomyces TaxID=2593676 RepID=UPI00224F556D|nr:SCO1431 family membrane protein [Streptomyces sp. NBC_01381]MCX4668702.1 SCO1431 family membrane protein [Streptomyces sp. NBC_01381]
MTASTATATAPRAVTRTGGPKEDGPKILEHVLGWTLVVVLAMLVTQTGLM